jgi:HPr kinase/phosphorylase
MTDLIHATAISIKGQGVILCGPSGSGKSDLALRLIDRGAALISDDQVRVDATSGIPLLYQAPNIAGKIEVRGVGIINMPFLDAIPLRMVVALDRDVERIPDGWPVETINGYHIPLLPVAPYAASAPIKVELALGLLIEQAILPVAEGKMPQYKN